MNLTTSLASQVCYPYLLQADSLVATAVAYLDYQWIIAKQ